MYHNLIQTNIDNAYYEFGRTRDAYADAEDWIKDLSLFPLLDLATRIFAHFSFVDNEIVGHPDWPVRRETGQRLAVVLYIPEERKAEAREIALASSVSRWSKSAGVLNAYYPRKVPYYYEEWRYELVPGDYTSDYIALNFYRPVQEGDVISGCKVQLEPPREAHRDLVLACKKEEGQ